MCDIILTYILHYNYFLSYSFEYKRDRYDPAYARSGGGGGAPAGGYHRDHRERDRERRPDKRR